MTIYVATKDFRFTPTIKSIAVRVKKGQQLDIANNKDFPDLEQKMLEMEIIKKPTKPDANILKIETKELTLKNEKPNH